MVQSGVRSEGDRGRGSEWVGCRLVVYRWYIVGRRTIPRNSLREPTSDTFIRLKWRYLPMPVSLATRLSPSSFEFAKLSITVTWTGWIVGGWEGWWVRWVRWCGGAVVRL